MNIHESQLDEFKDEQVFQKLNLSAKEVESWIKVRTYNIHVAIELYPVVLTMHPTVF